MEKGEPKATASSPVPGRADRHAARGRKGAASRRCTCAPTIWNWLRARVVARGDTLSVEVLPPPASGRHPPPATPL